MEIIEGTLVENVMTRKTLALLALMIGVSVHGHGHAQEVDWKERLEGETYAAIYQYYGNTPRPAR